MEPRSNIGISGMSEFGAKLWFEGNSIIEFCPSPSDVSNMGTPLSEDIGIPPCSRKFLPTHIGMSFEPGNPNNLPVQINHNLTVIILVLKLEGISLCLPLVFEWSGVRGLMSQCGFVCQRPLRERTRTGKLPFPPWLFVWGELPTCLPFSEAIWDLMMSVVLSKNFSGCTWIGSLIRPFFACSTWLILGGINRSRLAEQNKLKEV